MVFVEEETRKTRRKTLGTSENQQQTQPPYGTGLESTPGHIGGRRSLKLNTQLLPIGSNYATKHFNRFLFVDKADTYHSALRISAGCKHVNTLSVKPVRKQLETGGL